MGTTAWTIKSPFADFLQSLRVVIAVDSSLCGPEVRDTAFCFHVPDCAQFCCRFLAFVKTQVNNLLASGISGSRVGLIYLARSAAVVKFSGFAVGSLIAEAKARCQTPSARPRSLELISFPCMFLKSAWALLAGRVSCCAFCTSLLCSEVNLGSLRVVMCCPRFCVSSYVSRVASVEST